MSGHVLGGERFAYMLVIPDGLRFIPSETSQTYSLYQILTLANGFRVIRQTYTLGLSDVS